jgi:AmmeMemoRadiSam system protein B
VGSDNNTFLPRMRRIVGRAAFNYDGKELIVLQDGLHLSDQQICMLRPALLVVDLLDGKHSTQDIQTEIKHLTGLDVDSDVIDDLVFQLDQAYLLDTDRYREALQEKVDEYRARGFRPAAHAGMSYSSNAEELHAELQAFFNGDSGPGCPNYFSDSKRPVGLIAPHIDMRAGGKCFAHGYHALASGQPSDIYVIFGTGHEGVEDLFTFTRLDFESPLGRVETDRDFINAVEQELGYDHCLEELRHEKEHVIEFQTVMLQHVFGGRHSFKVVPILVALSHVAFTDDARFERDRMMIDRFCSAIKTVVSESNKSVCFIASADLDHVGPRYNDPIVPQQATVDESIRKDKEMLAHLERVDLDGFIQYVVNENDERHICGFSPISAMLRCMDATEGTLLDLDVVQVDQYGSFVSYCSLIFH